MKNEHAVALGKKGWQARKDTYDSEYFSKIGKRGGKVKKKKFSTGRKKKSIAI